MKEKITRVLAKVLKIEVTNSISTDNCGEWDSLNHLHIIIELETEFDISFEPDEIAQMKSIEAIERIVNEKIN